MFVKNWYSGISGQLNALSTVPVRNTAGTLVNVLGEYFRFSGVSLKSWFCALLDVRTVYNTYGGVIFGTGTTPPTMDDYKLSGEIIKTLVSSASCVTSVDDDGITVTTTYTLTNTSDKEITIGEIAAFTAAGSTTNSVMMDRTVLDTPVTIEPGGVGQITYSIRMNYPTA